MEKKKRRLERHKSHVKYILSGGEEVGGASSIAKMGDSPEPLIAWANKLGLEGKNCWEVRGKAADAGAIGHFMIDCYFDEVEPDLREFEQKDIDTAKTVFSKFMQFWEREGLTWVEKELPLVSELFRYGGTLDLVARDDEERLIQLDWKSSKQCYPSHKYQLGGYENLWNENRGQRIERRAIVLVSREESNNVRPYWVSDEEAAHNINVFKKQVELFNILRDNKQRYGKK